MTLRNRNLVGLAVALLLPLGCASASWSQDRATDTHAAMQAAEEIGGAKQPQTSLHLRYAHDQLDRARALLADGEEEEAARMLDRAHADAELALALARTQRSRSAAEEARNEVEALRSAQK